MESYLKFTGGAIHLDKSFIYMIDFQFKLNRDFKFILANQLDIELKVKDEFNIGQILEIIDSSIDKETLGVL